MKQTAIKTKPWTKPELIVLVRSQPEERVLTGCKNFDQSNGINEDEAGCFWHGCGPYDGYAQS